MLYDDRPAVAERLGDIPNRQELNASALRPYLDSIEGDPDMLEEVLAMLEEHPEETPPEPAARIGTRLHGYEITAILGSGAMGDVYSALDQELGRMVAIKLLTPGITASQHPVDRLISEARAASALNHPNIITVYGVIREKDDIGLVMELVEGKTLRHFCRNPPEFPSVVEWGCQIAKALAAAHQRSILHRDIKPENVMVRHDGLVKILDFGLARDNRPLNDSAIPDTSLGFSGTLSYMAPERVLGQPATSASDVFSLGIVLFELATGTHPFRQGSHIDTADEIAHGEPKKPSAVKSGLPPSLDRLVLAMLDKTPARRPGAAKVAATLENIGVEQEARYRKPPARKILPAAIWVAALVSFTGMLWFGLRYNSRTARPIQLRVHPLTSQDGWEGSPALSPDGDAVAFTWTAALDAPKQIYVKRLSSSAIVRLTGLEREGDPGSLVWSPDGKQIAFKRWDSEPGIYTIPSAGGSEKKITKLASGDLTSCLDWSPDGTELAFSDEEPGLSRLELYLLNLKTAKKRKLTSPPASVRGDWDPKFSPDGRTIAFKRVSGFWLDDLYTIPLTGGTPKRITTWQRGIWGHAWSSGGKTLVVSSQANGTVFQIIRFPLGNSEQQEHLTLAATDAITPATGRRANRIAWVNQTEDLNIYRIDTTGAGKPQKLIASVLRDRDARYSSNGRIAFISDRSGTYEIWVSDGDGGGQTRVGTLENAAIGELDWSPDGTQLAFSASGSSKPQIFLIACQAGGLKCAPPRQFTSDDSSHSAPEWSRNGRFLYFTSDRTGRNEIWRKPLTGGPPVQVTRSGGYASQESADGQWLYFSQWDGEVIWRIPGSESPQRDHHVLPKMVVGPPYRVRPASWALTSEDVFFVDRGANPRSAAIRAYHFSSGKIRTILGQMLTDRPQVDLSVSPDRRWLIYTRLDRFSGNIMVTEEGS